MNNLKLMSILSKLMLIVSIFTLTISTGLAQLTWDDQPSKCDSNSKRSINVSVKNNNFYASKFKIEVYNGDRFVHGGLEVFINKNETEKLTLHGIPVGEFKVIVRRNALKFGERFYNFRECENFEEETFDWVSKPSDCDESNDREIEVRLTNNSNSLRNYQMKLTGGEYNRGKILTLYSNGVNISPNQTKSIKIKEVSYGKYILTLSRGFDEIFSESIQLNACDLIVPDDVVWDDEPSVCNAYMNRSIEVEIKNNGTKSQNYKIEVHNYDDRLIRAGADVLISGKSKKRLTLRNIPPGNYRTTVVKKNQENNNYNVISSENYNFMPCPNTSGFRQVKAFQPFFTKIETPANFINLNEYFSGCTSPSYSVRKLSPGTTHNLSGSTLSITPTNSFLGKAMLEITSSCGAQKIVNVITLNVQASQDLTLDCNTQIVNIGVLNFDPKMPKYNRDNLCCEDDNCNQYDKATQVFCHEAFNGWKDPFESAEKYIDAITKASGNYIYFNMVEWVYANEFPVRNNGNQYNFCEYQNTYRDIKALNHSINLANADIDEINNQINSTTDIDEITLLNINLARAKATLAGFKNDLDTKLAYVSLIDYPKVVQQYGMVNMVNQKQIDEAWVFAGSYFGTRESCMAGPGSYYINGGTFPNVKSNRPFVIMGFSYARKLAQMMHNNGHRTESHLKRAYNVTWNRENPTTNWDKFSANEYQVINGTTAGAGNIHFTPNATEKGDDYKYNKQNWVESTALDFINYPNLDENNTTYVNSNTWSNVEGDYEEGFLKWWFSLLPKANGINNVGENADGRVNNWWKYVYDFNSYDYNGVSYNTIFQNIKYTSTQKVCQGIGDKFLFDLDDYFVDNDVALPQIRLWAFSNDIHLYKEGTKVYAHIPHSNSGKYRCLVRVCDGDYSSTNYFNLIVNDSNCDEEGNTKIRQTNTIETNNFPNPFSQQTTITYTLPQNSNVSIKVYNSAGKQIEVLSNNIKQLAGTHQINFDGFTYPSGIYYYSIQNGEHFKMQKMVLMKE